MTTADARKAGYEIVRGSYVSGSDDRAQDWYIQRIDADHVNRLGRGYRTRKDALEALAKRLAGVLDL